MPQLDFATYLPQIFWLFVTFISLYIIMAKVALPRVGEVIEMRRDKIAADLDNAQRLRSETDEAIASYEKALGDARSEASKIAQSTRDELSASTDKKAKEVEATLAKKLDDAEAKIKEMTDSAMAEVGAISTDTAQSLVETLLGEKADEKKLDAAIKSQLAS